MADVDDDFDDDDSDGTDDDPVEPVPNLPDPRKLLDPAARAARSLAIRRAIELRGEQKRMDRDLNYLDIDSN